MLTLPVTLPSISALPLLVRSPVRVPSISSASAPLVPVLVSPARAVRVLPALISMKPPDVLVTARVTSESPSTVNAPLLPSVPVILPASAMLPVTVLVTLPVTLPSISAVAKLVRSPVTRPVAPTSALPLLVRLPARMPLISALLSVSIIVPMLSALPSTAPTAPTTSVPWTNIWSALKVTVPAEMSTVALGLIRKVSVVPASLSLTVTVALPAKVNVPTPVTSSKAVAIFSESALVVVTVASLATVSGVVMVCENTGVAEKPHIPASRTGTKAVVLRKNSDLSVDRVADSPETPQQSALFFNVIPLNPKYPHSGAKATKIIG